MANLVRKYSCPGCELTDHLEVIDRAFSIRPVSLTNDEVRVVPRQDNADLLLQEVAVVCRACEWSHSLRDCNATIPRILRGTAVCTHD